MRYLIREFPTKTRITLDEFNIFLFLLIIWEIVFVLVSNQAPAKPYQDPKPQPSYFCRILHMLLVN